MSPAFVSPNNPDTASINAAIASLGSGGGVVWCPPGIYTVNDPTINVPSGVTLRGCGEATAFILPAMSGVPLIQIAHQAVGARVMDLYLNMSGFYHQFGMAVEAKQTRRCTISGLTIINIGKYGIVGNGDVQMTICNNHINKSTPDGANHNQSILMGNSLGLPLSVRISDNHCENSGMLLTLGDSLIADNDVNRSGYGSNMAFGEPSARNIVRTNSLTNGVGIDEGGFIVNGLENWGSMMMFVGNRTSFNDGVGFSQGGWGCHIAGHDALGNGSLLPQGTGIAFVSDPSSGATSAETFVNGVRTLNVNGKQPLPKYESPAVAGLIRYGTNYWQ